MNNNSLTAWAVGRQLENFIFKTFQMIEINMSNKRKEEGKDQEFMQSITTLNPGHRMEK